ncbi:hypothetical protein [Shimia ponticola]|uniref:hypothetical protein n=1 Tax=Shimia ponticola TaxID=2582893 RepID=UPI0011BF0257|nr:hypothetical protein [Shimia ponticola]
MRFIFDPIGALHNRKAKLETRRTLDRALALGSERIGDLVILLRSRSHAARRSARWNFVGLVLTVAVGIAFYLGLPFLRSYSDGQRVAAVAESKSITDRFNSAAASVLEKRDALTDVISTLPDFAEQIELNLRTIRGFLLEDDNLYFFGQGDTIFRVNSQSELAAANFEDRVSDARVDGLDSIFGIVPIDDISGVDSSDCCFVFGIKDENLASVTVDEIDFLPIETEIEITGSDIKEPLGHVVIGSRVFIYDRDGLVTSLDIAAANPADTVQNTNFDLSEDQKLWNIVERPDQFVALGKETLFEISKSDFTARSEPQLVLGQPRAVLEAWKLTGDYFNNLIDYQGQIYATTDQGILVPIVEETAEDNSAQLVLGRTVRQIRTENLDGEEAAIPIEDVIQRDGAMLFTGGNGTYQESSTDTEKRLRLQQMPGPFSDGDTFIRFNDELFVVEARSRGANLLRISGDARERAVQRLGQANYTPFDWDQAGAFAGYQQVAERIETVLETLNGASFEPLEDAIKAVSSAIAQNANDVDDWANSLARNQGVIEDYKNSPLRFFEISSAVSDMETFFEVCQKSDLREDVDCLAAWEKSIGSTQQQWWIALAEKLPPGVLLLFFLALLAGAYRYNVRLASFYSSRADVLEALTLSDEKKAEVFGQLTEMLSADRVEFGVRSNPTDQAVKLATAALSGKAT